MSYSTYITDALVCGVKDSNTSDRSYLLFTRDAGMLFANARSVREERSKQRYALQEFALVRVTLIKGKVGWRIGSIEALDNYYNTATDKDARGSVVKIFRQLRRFIHGEEIAMELFDFVKETLKFVSTEIEKRHFIDKVIQLRIFQLLGYVSINSVPEELLKTPLQEMCDLDQNLPDTKLDLVLEKAVTASHL